MKSQADDDLRELVSEARKSIDGGDHRFIEARCSLRDAWFPVATQPGLEEQLLSDYGLLDSNQDIAAEFEQEVSALIAAIARRRDLRSLKEVQKQDGSKEMLAAACERMSRRPDALALWDYYAAPVRLRGNHVYRIVSPRDVMGAPIIRSYPALLYVAEVAVKTAELDAELKRTRLSAARWKVAAAVLLAFVAMIVWLWVQ